MNRHPDQIIILEVLGDGPYEEVSYREMYRGRCKCFMDKKSVLHNDNMTVTDYQVVIPDRNMPDIGENYKVGVRLHNSKSDIEWPLVGYVRDFARYDRVCNLYFQMVKEHLIGEDIPTDETDDNGDDDSLTEEEQPSND